jgi:hypothetical protein
MVRGEHGKPVWAPKYFGEYIALVALEVPFSDLKRLKYDYLSRRNRPTIPRCL